MRKWIWALIIVAIGVLSVIIVTAVTDMPVDEVIGAVAGVAIIVGALLYITSGTVKL